MISTDRTNNKADKGHRWRITLAFVNISETHPLFITHVCISVKNRFIGFNLRQIQDIIDYADIYKIEGAIIFVDFTKAFDSLEWNFMLNPLKHFGFKTCEISLRSTFNREIGR
jgi:hypothetical protein